MQYKYNSTAIHAMKVVVCNREMTHKIQYSKMTTWKRNYTTPHNLKLNAVKYQIFTFSTVFLSGQRASQVLVRNRRANQLFEEMKPGNMFNLLLCEGMIMVFFRVVLCITASSLCGFWPLKMKQCLFATTGQNCTCAVSERVNRKVIE